MDQVSINYIYQHLPMQDPPKFTQIWIFGLITNHLATLPSSRKQRNRASVPAVLVLENRYSIEILYVGTIE
jgi:hypothetical protein